MTDPAKTLEFPIAKGPVWRRLFIVIIFLAAGLDLSRNEGHPIFGGIVIGFAGLTFFFGCRLLLDSGPGLVLSERGLRINRKIGSGDVVPWRQVRQLSLYRYGSDWHLLVQLVHPEKFEPQSNILRRALSSLNAATFGSSIRVNTSLLKCRREEVLRCANEFRSKYSGD